MMTKMDPQDQVGADKSTMLSRFNCAFVVVELLSGEVQLHLLSVVFVTFCFSKQDVFYWFLISSLQLDTTHKMNHTVKIIRQ